MYRGGERTHKDTALTREITCNERRQQGDGSSQGEEELKRGMPREGPLRTQYKEPSLDIAHYTTHEVPQAACVQRAIRAGSGCAETKGCPSSTGCVRFLLVNRSKAVKESEASGDVLEEFRDVVLDGGTVAGGSEQVLTVFGEMDAVYSTGVVA